MSLTFDLILKINKYKVDKTFKAAGPRALTFKSYKYTLMEALTNILSI